MTATKPGSDVTFGSYPQTIEGDMQPIEGIVLDYDESDNNCCRSVGMRWIIAVTSTNLKVREMLNGETIH